MNELIKTKQNFYNIVGNMALASITYLVTAHW